MMKKAAWVIGAVIVLVIGVIALTGAQSNVSQDATIQDLVELLLAEDGQSRLELLEGELEDIDTEVDLIHSVAERMLDDQYGFFDAEKWSLTDIKAHLNRIEERLDAIEACTCP